MFSLNHDGCPHRNEDNGRNTGPGVIVSKYSGSLLMIRAVCQPVAYFNNIIRNDKRVLTEKPD
jgi:hypothetical protein